METPIYYVGIFLKNKHTAIIQYVKEKDALNCEILEYYGKRKTTKQAVKEKIKNNKNTIIEYLKTNFKNCQELKHIQIN
jgi:hypothetical protein